MSKVHKENGGYIGKNYRLAYPSGIYVLGGVGGITDVTVDVELYGGKGDDYLLGPSALDPNSPSRKGGKGGYTKFRLILPNTYTLQVRPTYVTANDPAFQRGGAGSAVLLNDTWIGVVGGGGAAGGGFYYYLEGSQFLSVSANAGGSGQGGYGTGVPSNGASGSGCSYSDASFYGGTESGNGGAGAPGGTSGGTGCYGSPQNPGPNGGGSGGGGNLRIYKDQSVTSGYLSVLPDVYMQYITHSNGTSPATWTEGQVKITNVSSGQSYTYTSDADVPLVSIADNIFT